MKYIVADIESSGFKNTDSMHSFGWMEVDESFAKVYSSGILYFAPEDMKWTKEAYAVHGLSREFLESHADEFDDNMQKLYKLVERGNVIGYNTPFDIRFIRNHLLRYGYGELSLNSQLDVMQILRPKYGRNKLGVASTKFGFDEKTIQSVMKRWFPNSESTSYHTAEYDVCVTAMLFLRARAEKLI